MEATIMRYIRMRENIMEATMMGCIGVYAAVGTSEAVRSLHGVLYYPSSGESYGTENGA